MILFLSLVPLIQIQNIWKIVLVVLPIYKSIQKAAKVTPLYGIALFAISVAIEFIDLTPVGPVLIVNHCQ